MRRLKVLNERVIKVSEVNGNGITCNIVSPSASFIRLIQYLDKIADFLNKGNAMNLICLNLSKVFDIVPQGNYY